MAISRKVIGGEAGERVAFGDDGNRSAGADESTGKTSWRTGDASGGYGGGIGGASTFE